MKEKNNKVLTKTILFSDSEKETYQAPNKEFFTEEQLSLFNLNEEANRSHTLLGQKHSEDEHERFLEVNDQLRTALQNNSLFELGEINRKYFGSDSNEVETLALYVDNNNKQITKRITTGGITPKIAETLMGSDILRLMYKNKLVVRINKAKLHGYESILAFPLIEVGKKSGKVEGVVFILKKKGTFDNKDLWLSQTESIELAVKKEDAELMQEKRFEGVSNEKPKDPVS